MKEMSSPTYQATIYIAGSVEQADAAIREYCMKGLCVSMTKTRFIYTGGAEDGVAVGVINYPRFPKAVDALDAECIELAKFLITKLHQHSATVVTPSTTVFLSRRDA